MPGDDCNIFTCCECGEKTGAAHTHLDSYFCVECFEGLYRGCDECFILTERSLLIAAHSFTGDKEICQTCYERHYRTCNSCEEVFYRPMCHRIHDDWICYDCLEQGEYACCEECCTWMRTEDAYFTDDGAYCERHNELSLIHRYDYRPQQLKFQRQPFEEDELYFGIELEIESTTHSTSDISFDLNESISDAFYFKEDGSIDDGFEIVSHPMTFSFIKENQHLFSPIFDLKNRGARSYDTSTCGMHIHFTKDAVSRRGKFNLIEFFEKNRDLIFYVSRRRRGAFNSWCSSPHLSEATKLAVVNSIYNGYGKYYDLNFDNTSTIECRIFRGTLSKTGFMANIEFIHGIIKYCENAIPHPSTKISMRWTRFLAYMKAHKDLYPNFDEVHAGRLKTLLQRNASSLPDSVVDDMQDESRAEGDG